MLAKPETFTESFFVDFARRWFKSIAAGSWDLAFAQLDLPRTSGEPYTPTTFRREIEVDCFGEGTRFRSQHPDGIVYADPDDIGPSQHTFLGRLATDQATSSMGDVELEHPVPLNGEWSDLTACFHFVDRGAAYAVRLDWLDVL